MTCCFRNSSRHAIQIGISKQKILFYLFVLCNAVFDGFFKLFFVLYNFDEVYSTFLQVLTATSCSFIISFVTQRQVTKIFLAFFLPFKKSIIIITQHVTLLVFCIVVFTLFNIYLRMIIFTLFVGRIDL